MVLCFYFFHRLSAGSFIYLNDGSGNFGNLNMNGELMFNVLSGYIFYDLVMIVSFFLIVETHEKGCSCVFKNSASFFLLCFLLVSLDVKGMIKFLFATHNTAQLFANIDKDFPNFLSSLPNTDQLFASLTED